jgi:hypothetical protein
MKRVTAHAASFVVAACLIACTSSSPRTIDIPPPSTSGQITTEKAQQALNQWIAAAGGGQVSIVGGVRELPAENAAIADLTVTNLTWQSQTNETRRYSGAGKATFVHYTDGHWALSKVTVGDVYASTSWSPNMEIR